MFDRCLRIGDYTMCVRVEGYRFTVGVKSAQLAVCWQMSCYIVTVYTFFFT